MKLPDLAPLAALTDDVCTALRARFSDVGFVPRSVGAAEAIGASVLFDAARAPLVSWHLAAMADPASQLLRLFLYRDSLSLPDARAGLGDSLFDAIHAAGLVAIDPVDPTRVRALFDLAPFHGLWILGDIQWTHEDAVMGASVTTQRLSDWMPPALDGAMLDVGCGAGTLALLAASRGARAVGTDVNTRAVELARINARLNGLTAEFLHGSLYEPVAGRRFELVMAQPPFIPRAPGVTDIKILYGGSYGDELALRFVAECPAVIAPRGRALFLFESAVRPGNPLHARLRPMFGEAPVDVALLHCPAASPDLDAVMFASNENRDLGPGFVEAARRRWEHFRALDVKEILSVLAVLRAQPEGVAQPGFMAAVRAGSLRSGSSAALDTFLAGLDLSHLSDEALLNAAVTVARGAVWVEERSGPDPSVEPRRKLNVPHGIASSRELSEPVYLLLAFLTEGADVTEAVARYAEVCGTTPDQVQKQVLGFVREMLATGILEARA